MDDRFDQEFYRSEWQRVLPLGPGGIQPYVHAARTSRLPGLRGDLGRLIAALGGAVAQGVIALGRFAAIGMAKRPILLASTPQAQWQRLSGRIAHEPTCSAARQAAATRCVCEVA
jgi:hypothetical protein